MTSKAALVARMYEVRYGVAGAGKVKHKLFGSYQAAATFADSWRNSNALGHYLATIYAVTVEGPVAY